MPRARVTRYGRAWNQLAATRAPCDGGPVRFRLYVEGSRLHLVVLVWPSLRALRQYITAAYPGNGSYRRTLGMCSSFKVVAYPMGKRSRTRPIFAELNLCAANLTMRIVTHELMHATLAYARRVGLVLGAVTADLDDRTMVHDVEEKLCDVHGTFCSDFVRRATELGLYDDRGEMTPWKAWERAA